MAKKKDDLEILKQQLSIIEELLIEALTGGFDHIAELPVPAEGEYVIPTALLDEVEIITGIRPNFMAIT